MNIAQYLVNNHNKVRQLDVLCDELNENVIVYLNKLKESVFESDKPEIDELDLSKFDLFSKLSRELNDHNFDIPLISQITDFLESNKTNHIDDSMLDILQDSQDQIKEFYK